MHTSLPLTYDADGFILDIELVPKGVLLHRVLRFPGNTNTPPTLERFLQLPDALRREIISQINRKYRGKRVFIL